MAQRIAGVVRRIGLAALIVIVAAGAGFATYRWHEARNKPAPDVSFLDLDGHPHKLSDYRARLTLVNFWASWCAPCMNELPLLVKAQAEFGERGLKIIGPAMDESAPVREAMAHFKINYPVLGGEDEVMAAMEALGDDLGALPFSVLIAEDGKVLDRIYGGLSAERLKGLLEQHLPR